MSKNLYTTEEFDNSHNKNSTNSIKKALVEALVFILTLAIIAPIAMYTVNSAFGMDTSPFLVAGHSMDPTLEDGQVVLVSPPDGIIDNGAIVVTLLPEKGYQFTSDKEAQFIVKRIIAGPGETIDIGYDDSIRINGEVVDEPYLTETAKSETYVPNYQTHYELADDEYFVVGDNRGHSCDSRYFGVVKYEEITGVVSEETSDSSFMAISVAKYAIGIILLYFLVEKILTALLRKIFKV